MQGGWRGGAGEEAAYQGGINEFPSVESQLTSFDRKKQQKEWLGLDFFFRGVLCGACAMDRTTVLVLTALAPNLKSGQCPQKARGIGGQPVPSRK